MLSLAGDRASVTIGKGTNLQDNVYVGGTSEFSPNVHIGDHVSVGHGAVLKGCTVGSNVLIGINAVVSEGAKVCMRVATWGGGGSLPCACTALHMVVVGMLFLGCHVHAHACALSGVWN